MVKTIQWVGNICLQRAGESEQARGIPQSEFLKQWRDLLPEGWREHASVDLLKVCLIVTFLLSKSNENAGQILSFGPIQRGYCPQ